jgi:uncharacterized protein YjiS (DUF1127 family)
MERIVSMNWTVPFAAQNTGERWLRRFWASLERRWSAYSRWRVEQRAGAQLHAMSDRELQDIGLIRSEISRAVNIIPLADAGSSRREPLRPTKWRSAVRTVR